MCARDIKDLLLYTNFEVNLNINLEGMWNQVYDIPPITRNRLTSHNTI